MYHTGNYQVQGYWGWVWAGGGDRCFKRKGLTVETTYDQRTSHRKEKVKMQENPTKAVSTTFWTKCNTTQAITGTNAVEVVLIWKGNFKFVSSWVRYRNPVVKFKVETLLLKIAFSLVWFQLQYHEVQLIKPTF